MKYSLLVLLFFTLGLNAFSQGSETFSNLTSSASYATVNWTGDNGQGWSATDTRTDQVMNGKCAVVRVGAITTSNIPNGIKSLTFKHQQFFSGTGGVLEVRINGTLIGSVNPTTTLQTASFDNINVTGTFSLEIKQTTASLRIGIDDIIWTNYSGLTCTAPTTQPTALNFSSIQTTTANVSFTAAATTDKYLVIRSTSSTLSVQPANGTLYTEGDAIGNGIIAYYGANTSFVATDMQPGTQNYFFVYEANDVNCNGGPAYNLTSPLTGNITTATPPVCQTPTANITGLTLSAASNAINGTYNTSADADATLVIVSTAPLSGFTPANGTTYLVGQGAGNGFVVKSSAGSSFVASGLNSNTKYYITVYSYNNSNCTGGPLYLNSTVSANATTTTAGAGDWPTGYYDYANNKTCSTLKTALRDIIDNNSGSFTGDTYKHNTQSYDALWDQYKITDIKPREVGSGSNMVIYDIYSDNPTGTDPYNFTPGTKQCGSYSGESSCYNREHSFPKSWFNDASPMYSDYIHILPTDGYVNGKRSNFKYGEVASATWTSQNGSKLGSSAIAGIGGPVFEPLDSFKGDVARIYLYMVTRYQSNLATWKGYNTEGAETLDGTTFPSVEINYLKMMLKWHNLDPVSQKEKIRNNGSFSFQGNRNPFVDRPEFVDLVWNANCPGLAALPVDLISFSGKLQGNKVILKWEAMNELNFARFDVERSVNGVEFAYIGSVKAANLYNYSFTDNIEQLSGKKVYYRLKRLDKDGKFVYSDVVSINLPLNVKFTVYPNPTKDVVTISLNSNTGNAANVMINDVTGKTVLTKTAIINSGNINLPVSQLNSGIYFITLSINGEQWIQKLIIAK